MTAYILVLVLIGGQMVQAYQVPQRYSSLENCQKAAREAMKINKGYITTYANPICIPIE